MRPAREIGTELAGGKGMNTENLYVGYDVYLWDDRKLTWEPTPLLTGYSSLEEAMYRVAKDFPDCKVRYIKLTVESV
jgi:hypothetical protein